MGVAASHDGNIRGVNQGQGNAVPGHQGAHSTQIKSYDSAALQHQRATNNISVGGQGVMNFQTVQANQREVANNSALAISREGSMNRRSGHANASSHLQG